MNDRCTLLVVIEDGGEVTVKDHSFFTISNIRVSPCPGKCRGRIEYLKRNRNR